MRPLAVGERAVVKVKVRNISLLEQPVRLEASEGVTVETPNGVRIPAKNEVAWRIHADGRGKHRLLVAVSGEQLEKELVVGEGWGPVSAMRTGKNLWEMLLWPGEKQIAPSSAIESIEIKLSLLDMLGFGWSLDWLIVFFILSIAFGFACKDLLGVQV